MLAEMGKLQVCARVLKLTGGRGEKPLEKSRSGADAHNAALAVSGYLTLDESQRLRRGRRPHQSRVLLLLSPVQQLQHFSPLSFGVKNLQEELSHRRNFINAC